MTFNQIPFANILVPPKSAVLTRILVLALFGLVISATPLQASEVESTGPLQKYGELPLSFERRGDLEFVARGQGYAMDIRGARATIDLPASGVSGAINMEFVDGRQVAATPEKELPGKVNYIFGKDPQRWRLGLPTYERVTYHDVYAGIDVVYYGNQKQLEFDLVLKPGADVGSIRMRFDGAGRVHTDSSGGLMLGDLRLTVPTVIQGRKTIAARYKMLANGEVAVEVGAYDRSQPLTIDPTLVYSTRLGGGNGGNQGNQGNAIGLDASGNAYIAGYTNAADFPVGDAIYAGYQANTDSFISKLNPTGTALIYSTYIGGSNSDYLTGIAIDSTGAAWAAGYTFSSDFPLLAPYQNVLGGGSDAVVIKLSSSGALTYSTFLGGSDQDLGYAVAVDPFGNAYVAGYAGPGFPTTAGTYQSVNQGGVDAFVTKFTSGGSLQWSTFAGGTSFDYATGIAADPFGNAYITGTTYSNSFPHAPSGGAQPLNKGNGDAFVAKLNFNASTLIYFTFLGGAGTDSATGIAMNPASGAANVAGNTTSTDLSTSAGAVQAANAGGYDGFVAKLNAEGSAFLYTTYVGGNRRDAITGLAVDPNGNVYVTGYTDSNTFVTSAAIQPSIQGNSTSLFRTSDAGATWSAADANISGSVLGISPDPANSGNIIASTNNGTYRTTNAGATWVQQTPVGYMTLARSRANPATIYGLTGSQVYQSSDNGITWTFRGSLAACCGGTIVADPSNPAAAYIFNSFNSSIPAVQNTTNNGVTWSPAITGLPANALVTAMAAGADGSIYAGLAFTEGASPGGIYKSINEGATWTAITSGLPSNLSVPPQGLAVAPSNPSLLYVTDYFTLFKSVNGGTLWSTVGGLPGGTSALSVSYSNPDILHYSDYNSTAQMWFSENGGVSWSASGGIGVGYVNRILPDPFNAAGAYGLAGVSVVPIVAKINPTGQNLLYSTFLGGQGAGNGITTNGAGEVFVTGSTYEFPTTPSALQRNRNIYQNTLDGFVARISDATAACSYSVDPSDKLEVWHPHLVHYVVTAPSGCAWSASSNQPWATIASGASGTGSGIVDVLVGDDATPGTRSATLNIGGQNVSLRQRPGSCGYNIFSPDSSVVPGGGGTVAFNVIAAPGCEWSITNNDPTAVTVVSGATGTGNGSVILNVAPNLGPNSRTFIIGSLQGDTETISQAGTTAPAVVATVTSSPSDASITVTGSGCIPGTYTTPASLTWNATTNCTVFFTTPQTIAGTLSVFNSARVNGGAATAGNPLTVNSGNSTLTINANFMNPCSYSLSPKAQEFGSQGGIGSFAVTTAAACSWNATSSVTWVTILPSASRGTGTVNYSVAANTGATRKGTISVNGQNYVIDQQAFSCAYSINPEVGAFSNTGGTARVVVSAPAGCPWTATSNAPWVTPSVSSGSGPGAVVVSAGANAGASRSGTVTIAGWTFSATQGGGACGAFDVTSQAPPSRGPFIPYTFGLTQGITVTNHSSATIPGPIYVVLIGEPTHYGDYRDTFLGVNPGTTTCFSTRGDYLSLVTAGGLAPNQSVSLQLNWQGNFYPSYSPKVLSGRPSH